MIQHLDSIRPRLNVVIIEHDAVTGHELRRQTGHNLVTTAGRNMLRDFLANTGVAGITHYALGTSATAATLADTALGAEVLRTTVAIWNTASASLEVRFYLGSTQGNGSTLAEAGLFNAASGGSMYARYVLASPIVKTSAVAVTFTWTLTWV